jgi:TRAP-type mannitol/chloroaromatic compound transport system permease small subunit
VIYVDRLLSIIDKLSKWTGKTVSWICLGIAAVLLIDIATRTIGQPMIWTHDMVYYLFGTYFLIAGAYTFLDHNHVKVDIFYGKFSPRTRSIINLCTWPFFFLFVGTMLWWGFRSSLTSVFMNEKFTSTWAPPLYILKMMVTIGALLLFLQGIAHLVRDIKVIAGKVEK